MVTPCKKDYPLFLKVLPPYKKLGMFSRPSFFKIPFDSQPSMGKKEDAQFEN